MLFTNIVLITYEGTCFKFLIKNSAVPGIFTLSLYNTLNFDKNSSSEKLTVLECNFLLPIEYTKIKQTDDQGNVIGQREAAKMRFRLNLLNIRIGLNILL